MNEALNEKAKAWNESFKVPARLGRELGMEIEKRLKPIIPDIEYQLGWEEAGMETLCFLSESHSASSRVDLDTFSGLENIIEDAIPALKWNDDNLITLDTPFGVYVSKDEAKRIRQALVE